MAQQQTIEQELAAAGVPANFAPIDRAPIIPGRPSQGGGNTDGSTRYMQATIPPGQQHDSTFVDTAYRSPNAPEVSLMPLAPSGLAQVNSAVKSVIIQETPTPTPVETGGNMNFQGVWSSTTGYSVDDVVLFNNSTYIATAANNGSEPDTNPSDWTLLSKNFNFRGQYQTQVVQANNVGPSGSGSTSLTVSFSNNTVAKNSIVVFVYGPNRSFTTLTCADSQGNTYTQEAFVTGGAGNNFQATAIFLTSGIVGGADTITITCDGAHVMGNTKIAIFELLGGITYGSSTLNTTNGSATVTTFSTTATATEMALCYISGYDSAGWLSYSFASGFTPVPIVLAAGNDDLGEVNMSPQPSGGNITSGFNGTVGPAFTDGFGQLSVSLSYNTNRYEPFDMVLYEGSSYVCVMATSSAPSPINTNWAQLSQGTGHAQIFIASYAAVLSDSGTLLSFNSSSGVTLTLPSVIPNLSWYIKTQNTGSGALSVNPNGLLIDNSNASISLSQGQGLDIYTDGANYYTMRGSGGGGAGALTKIAEVVLSGSQATITFSSIPATYRNLVLAINARCDIATSGQNGYIEFNGDTGNNYSESYFDTNGTAQGTGNSTSSSPTSCTFLFYTGASATANLATSAKVFINNYAGTVFSKNAIAQLFTPTALGSATGLILITQALNWNSTAAINAIVIGLTAAGNFITGSTFTLYGES